MTITKTKEGGRLVLSLAGRLDTTTAPQLDAELKQSLDGVTELVLDFAELAYLSSAGLRVLQEREKGRTEDHEQAGNHGDPPCERDDCGNF